MLGGLSSERKWRAVAAVGEPGCAGRDASFPATRLIRQLTTMEPIGDVARLALLYRECHRNRHTSPDSLLEDFESCPGEVSLATMYASSELTRLD